MNHNKEITYLRAETANGFNEGPISERVEREGGKYQAGLIRGFAVITRGEALGHGMWIDQEFVESVYRAFSQGGLKSRYTHPGMSADGLSKGLGRAFNPMLSGDVAFADLHFFKSSHKSPDGDLAEHVMTRAEEDPESFGSSIVFASDLDAEKKFYNEHLVDDEKDGKKYFQSPDELNTKNLPHARLGQLRAVDIVDDPAANPNGLFCVDNVFEEFNSVAEYAIGLSDKRPELVSFDLNPDRVQSFFQRFLDSKGLQIMSKEEKQETPKKDEDNVSEVNLSEELTEEKIDPRAEAKQFIESFGAELGGQYYADGLSFTEAQANYSKHLSDENNRLKAEVEHLKNSSSEAVGGSPEIEEEASKPRTFAAAIKFSNN